jgi:uncharacterized membrane protein YhaH (DUF805 family)
MNWYLEVLKKYAVFDGRARRTEYWMFFLFNVLIWIGLSIVGAIVGLRLANGVDVLSSLYALAVFIPGIAVCIRRLHDIGKAGWYLLVVLIPCAGPFILLYFLVQDSQPGPNQYGPNSKGL